MNSKEFSKKARELKFELAAIYQESRNFWARLALGLEVPDTPIELVARWVRLGEELRMLIKDAAEKTELPPPPWHTPDELEALILTLTLRLQSQEAEIAWKHQIMDFHGVSTWAVGVKFPHKDFIVVVYWDNENRRIVGGSQSSATGAIFEANLTLDERVAIENALDAGQ